MVERNPLPECLSHLAQSDPPRGCVKIDDAIESAIWAIHDVGIPDSLGLDIRVRLEIRSIMRNAVRNALRVML
jgi:hypothetical protein